MRFSSFCKRSSSLALIVLVLSFLKCPVVVFGYKHRTDNKWCMYQTINSKIIHNINSHKSMNLVAMVIAIKAHWIFLVTETTEEQSVLCLATETSRIGLIKCITTPEILGG